MFDQEKVAAVADSVMALPAMQRASMVLQLHYLRYRNAECEAVWEALRIAFQRAEAQPWP